MPSQSMIGGADIEDLGINAVACGHAAVDVSPRSVADFPTFLQHDEVRRHSCMRNNVIVAPRRWRQHSQTTE